MITSWSYITLLLLSSLRTLRGTLGKTGNSEYTLYTDILYVKCAGSPSLSLSVTSPIDVLSGNTVCSNTTVEFTCIASDIDTLGWQRGSRTMASMLITSWHVSAAPHPYHDGSIDVYLNKTVIGDSDAEGRQVFTNITSTLVGTVDQGLHSGDEIRCVGRISTDVMESLILNYSIITGK